MAEGYWANSQFSVVRYTGRMKWNGITYIICNKEGKDIFQCSIEAVNTSSHYQQARSPLWSGITPTHHHHTG